MKTVGAEIRCPAIREYRVDPSSHCIDRCDGLIPGVSGDAGVTAIETESIGTEKCRSIGEQGVNPRTGGLDVDDLRAAAGGLERTAAAA